MGRGTGCTAIELSPAAGPTGRLLILILIVILLGLGSWRLRVRLRLRLGRNHSALNSMAVLPLGEGESFTTWVRTRSASTCHSAERATGTSECPSGRKLFPLPEGGGQGEGNEALRIGRHCIRPTINSMAG